MKKLVGIASLVVMGLFAGNVSAQKTTTDGVSNEVNLNVILNPVRTLTVNQNEVNLVYNTAEDYANGVSETIDNHLTVTSIGSGFKVYAKASTNDLIHTNGAQLSESATNQPVSIRATANNNTTPGQVYERTVQTMNAQNDDGHTYGVPVVHGGAGLNQAYNVTYTAAGDNAYLNKVIDNQQTTYAVTIMYTITTD